MKSFLHFLAVVLGGAVVGTFLGKMLALWFPAGIMHNLFATEVSAGLRPFMIDLVVAELTFGCLFDINMTSILGILIAALIYRYILK
ncbi:MAG: DUF4321 domain-containing protein [bacterium]